MSKNPEEKEILLERGLIVKSVVLDESTIYEDSVNKSFYNRYNIVLGKPINNCLKILGKIPTNPSLPTKPTCALYKIPIFPLSKLVSLETKNRSRSPSRSRRSSRTSRTSSPRRSGRSSRYRRSK